MAMDDNLTMQAVVDRRTWTMAMSRSPNHQYLIMQSSNPVGRPFLHTVKRPPLEGSNDDGFISELIYVSRSHSFSVYQLPT